MSNWLLDTSYGFAMVCLCLISHWNLISNVMMLGGAFKMWGLIEGLWFMGLLPYGCLDAVLAIVSSSSPGTRLISMRAGYLKTRMPSVFGPLECVYFPFDLIPCYHTVG